MSSGELSEKSSSRQLWAELQRLRAKSPVELSQDREAEYARSRGRESELLSQLRAAREGAAASGVAGERVAGKPAVSDFRNLWGRFTLSILRLPALRERFGMAAVELAVSRTVLPDLFLLELMEPRGPREAEDRNRIRRMLVTPSFVAVLTRREPWATRARARFLASTARVYFRPSVWRAYEEGPAELPRPDYFGSVVK